MDSMNNKQHINWIKN